jgi:nitrogen fixation/metabolism regulation signal transduction histidine kinase
MTEMVWLAEIDLSRERLRNWRVVVIMLGLAACIAATRLPAQAFAGRTTTLNVQVVITLTIAITLAGVAALISAYRRGKDVHRLETRNAELERDVRELKKRCRDNDLDDATSGD